MVLTKFLTPDLSDNRIIFAAEALKAKGYQQVASADNADFVLLGVNPKKEDLTYSLPIFAGNIGGAHIYDYTKQESFALENAYLTAEGAVSLLVSENAQSLLNAPVLITGYGRIGKALHHFLQPFTRHITVCARNENARQLAACEGAKTLAFPLGKACSDYRFLVNTVPHPVFGKEELLHVRKDAMLLELASFPGGIDRHLAEYLQLHVVQAKGLPAKFSPKTAGEVLARCVDNMIKEECL